MHDWIGELCSKDGSTTYMNQRLTALLTVNEAACKEGRTVEKAILLMRGTIRPSIKTRYSLGMILAPKSIFKLRPVGHFRAHIVLI